MPALQVIIHFCGVVVYLMLTKEKIKNLKTLLAALQIFAHEFCAFATSMLS